MELPSTPLMLRMLLIHLPMGVIRGICLTFLPSKRWLLVRMVPNCLVLYTEAIFGRHRILEIRGVAQDFLTKIGPVFRAICPGIMCLLQCTAGIFGFRVIIVAVGRNIHRFPLKIGNLFLVIRMALAWLLPLWRT